MLDDFREQANTSAFETEEEDQSEFSTVPSGGRLLGMTPQQRFVLALLLLLITCLLTTFCLLVTEKVVPPFL